MKKFHLTVMWALLAIFSTVQSALAATVHFSGSGITGKKGSYEAEISYVFLGDQHATVTIGLTNTSKQHGAGYITALAFNNPLNLITDVVMASSDADFSLIGQPDFRDTIAVSPFGSFDIGASIATGSNNLWLGGQNPALGIDIGQKETFVFDLLGSGFLGLDEQSFLDTFSYPNQKKSEFFAVRFRGHDGMDRVSSSAVPLPPTVFLLGTALLGLIGVRNKKT